MKKLEDKVNLTRFDYFIYYKQLKEESDNVNRLLDENKLYLTKLENLIKEKNYEIKQLTNDYDKTSKLLIVKIKENEKLKKEFKKVTKNFEKKQNVADKQHVIIDELNYELGKLKEELSIVNDRLEFCKNHRRAPDIEELKAYTYKEGEVTKRIRRKNVS